MATNVKVLEINEEMAAPRYILVDVLAIFFGISSWVEISGLAAEMPLMVPRLPEGWKLASYTVVVTQLANIGPLLYGLARKKWSHQVLEVPVIHITLMVAATSCLLLSFFWDRTSIIAGENHSTALLILTFCLALVDCTSSVLYLPFMACFRDIYVLSCMAGEGMSGLFPSILGLIQGVGGNPECMNITIINVTEFGNETVHKLVPFIPSPRFSVELYFILLCVMVVISWTAFILLNKHPGVQNEKVSSATQRILDSPFTNSQMQSQPEEVNYTQVYDGDRSYTHIVNHSQEYYILLVIQTYVCVVHNGILSSIQTFSCLPYGSVPYHLSINLSLISNPIACFIAMFWPVYTLKTVIYVTVFSTVWALYILVIALLSPTPPLINSAFGGILVVFAWVAFVGAVSHVKASIAGILRRTGGNKALFWGGALSQIGSFFGGVTMFLLVNLTHLFKSESPCPN